MLREFGLDYGLKPRLMLVSDMSFPEFFQKAKCMAIAFIHCPDSHGNLVTTEIGFLCEVEEYAEKFMDCLMQWVKDSGDDGDAVELEFIELFNGEYMLGIAPNVGLFFKRMLDPMLKERVDPIFSMATQGKGGMRIGENYSLFKSQYVKGRRIPVRIFYGSRDGKIQKNSERYFVKTEFKFSKEGELPNESLGHGLLAKKDKPFNPKNFKRKGPVDMTPIEKRRMEELNHFFPLLLDRIEREKWLEGVIASIPPYISRPEVIQAICNIVLLERLKQNNPLSIKTDGPGYDMNLFKHLLQQVESFSSYFPPPELFTKAQIKKQVKLDKKYLTEYLQKI
jgi:hypothetical protein